MTATLLILILGESAAFAGLLGFHSVWLAVLVILGLGISFQQIISSYLRGEAEKTLDAMKADKSWDARSERITTHTVVWLTRRTIQLPTGITIAACAIVLYRYFRLLRCGADDGVGPSQH